MIIASLESSVIGIFINDIQIMALKKSRIIKYKNQINIHIFDNKHRTNHLLPRPKNRVNRNKKDY